MPASLPVSHFPSCRTRVSPGAKGTHSGLELRATLVMFLLYWGLNTLGGRAGNLSTFCKNVSMDKCAPSAEIPESSGNTLSRLFCALRVT